MTARTITTAAELDALPWGAVVARTIFGEPGEDWHKRRDGMWLGTGGDVWAADLLAAASDRAHMALTLVAPVVPVVSDAAVEAAALVLAGLWGAPGVPDVYRPEARAALTAALPHLAAAPSATREDVETITIPRPHVPHGPATVAWDVADADYLRRAARDLEGFYKPFGSNLRATIVALIRDAADAITPRTDR